jgi:CBS domain-containing protein
VLCFLLLAEAADRTAQRDDTVVDRDCDRFAVDLRIPERLVGEEGFAKAPHGGAFSWPPHCAACRLLRLGKSGGNDQFCENARNEAAGALLLSHDLRATGLRSHLTRRGGTMAKSVRDAMTEDPRSIGASASVVEAARLMREEHIGSLPITDDEQLVGMITDRDITTRVVAEAADPKMTSVGDVYSRDLISVEPDKDLEEALQLMARHQVRRLPVVENGRLVGIVAQADIALRENEKKTGELVEAISEPSEGERS